MELNEEAIEAAEWSVLYLCMLSPSMVIIIKKLGHLDNRRYFDLELLSLHYFQMTGERKTLARIESPKNVVRTCYDRNTEVPTLLGPRANVQIRPGCPLAEVQSMDFSSYILQLESPMEILAGKWSKAWL